MKVFGITLGLVRCTVGAVSRQLYLLGAAALSFGAVDAANATAFESVIAVGDAAPGFAPQDNVTITNLIDVALNESGQIAIQAWQSQSGDAAYIGTKGNLSLAVKEGDVIDGYTFDRIRDIRAFNNNGELALQLGRPSDNNRGIWTNIGGTQRVIAQEGTQVSTETGQVLFENALVDGISDTGDLYISAEIYGTGTTSNTGTNTYEEVLLRMDSSGSLSRILRTGQEPDVNRPGMSVRDIGYRTRVNNQGDAVFGFLRIGGGQGDNTLYTPDDGIFLTEGDQVDLGPSYRLSGNINPRAIDIIGSSGIDDNGDIYVIISHETDVAFTYDHVIARYDFGTDSLTPIVGTMQAPGLAAGIFMEFLNDPLVANDSGDFIFRATLEDRTGSRINNGNDDTVWAYRDGVLTMLAREGDAALGVDPSEGTVWGVHDVVINDAGDIMFAVQLDGTGITTANESVLYGFDSNGLKKIFREGEQIEVDGTMQTISGLIASNIFAFPAGSSDGWPNQFNNAGDFAFNALIDGVDTVLLSNFSNDFTNDVDPGVPLPAAVWMMLGGVGLLAPMVGRTGRRDRSTETER